jgi:hypothetical protein
VIVRLILRAEPHPVDPILRLRQLLKWAWRHHRLRCVGVATTSNQEVAIMKMSTAFPSKFLRAADIADLGGSAVYTVRKVVLEEVGQDKTTKPVVYFRQIQQGLVLNRTNAARLSASLGDESDAWIGKQIGLEVERVPMRGQLVDSIKAGAHGKYMEEHRLPSPLESQIATKAPLDDLDDELPF